MYSNYNLFFVTLGAIICMQVECADKKEFIFIANYVQCEGKDSGNYSLVAQQQSDAKCSQDSIETISASLIENGPKGEKTVIGMAGLASSRYPAGADVITDDLVLFTSGSLVGKYGFFRTKHLIRDYLKKCSSVLGYSFIRVKISQLLISNNLDPNVLISSTGAYDAFKKGCTTICNGDEYGV